MSINEEGSLKVRCFSIFRSFLGSQNNQNDSRPDLKNEPEQPAIAIPAALQIPDVASAYIYPPHQSITIVPAAPPPSIKIDDVVVLEEVEEGQYNSINILASKHIPDHFSKKCQTEFGLEVFSLVEKVSVFLGYISSA